MYPWQHERRFNAYPQYFRKTFGARVQKVSIDAGFTCPNRDGTIGYGGCTFCDNRSFNPSYCDPEKSVREQIRTGIQFHSRRYHNPRQHLAYFQAFSNTHAPLAHLKKLYKEALSEPQIIGLVIGTRPDCLDAEKLKYFQDLAQTHMVILEIGIESCYDTSLKRMNRGHSYQQAVDMICSAAAHDLRIGTHMIVGLPGESEAMLIESAQQLSKLPIHTVKFHQLQLIYDTAMLKDYEKNPKDFRFYQFEEYCELMGCMIERLRPEIVIERFFSEAAPEYNATPVQWEMRNDQMLQVFERYLEQVDTWQGRLYALGNEQK